MATVTLNPVTEAEIVQRMTARLMPSKYEEPNRREAEMHARLLATQLLNDVLDIMAARGGK